MSNTTTPALFSVAADGSLTDGTDVLVGDDADVTEEDLAVLDVEDDEDDAADEFDEAYKLVVADRAYEEFDWERIVADLNLSDITGSLAVLEAHRLPFTRAARAEGKKNPAAEFYNAANGPLFRKRTGTKERIAELEGMDPASEDAPRLHALELHRAHRRLESLTELIVRLNYGMTRKYVRQFTSNTSLEDSLDFQGAANVGLMIAIDSFDPARGRFGSWAYKPIQRAVLKAVRDADFKNMNEGDFEKRPKVLKAYNALLAKNPDVTPSFAEVAVEAGAHVDLVRRILAAPHLDSIHTPVGSDDSTAELGDLIPDDEAQFEDSVISALGVSALMEYGLPALEAREHYVIVRVYGLDGEAPDALADIGNQLGLSREAVRQIRGKAMAKLLHPTTMRKLVRAGRA